MSTKEQLYTMIDSMTEQQMQELIRFLDGHKKRGNASGDVKGILSAYADPQPCSAGGRRLGKKCP